MGLDGQLFSMWKFRTMVPDAERETGAVWAVANDARRTPLGAFLRKTNLDEIPQFWNILRGEMSVVGPRPERPEFIREFRAGPARLHAAPQGEGRPHRLGAGERLPRQHLDREAARVRHGVPAPLVARRSTCGSSCSTLLRGFNDPNAY